MATDEPAAQASYRVPRSYLDDHLLGVPLPATRVMIGIVLSLEATSCTVLILDEPISGVIWLGVQPPNVGDIVEVEQRGELLVIPASNDTFTEGVETSVHIVSDEDPGAPEADPVHIAGSMADTDGWYFLAPDTGNWNREAYTAGPGLRVYETPSVLLSTNYVPNPNAEGATGWESNGAFGGATLATLTYNTDLAYVASGTRSVKVVWPDLTVGTNHSNAVILAATPPVDTPMCFSVRVFVPLGSPDVRPSVLFYAGGSSTDVKGEWVWLHTTFTTGPGPVGYYCGVVAENPVAGGVCYVDTAILRPGGIPGPDDLIYFDGATPDTATETYAWTGTVNDSTSTRTLGQTPPVGPGELWNFAVLDVAPGDVLDFTSTASWLGGSAPVPYLSEVLPDSPSVLWMCNDAAGATSVTDSSGNGKTGTKGSGVTLGTGGTGLISGYPTAAVFGGTTTTANLVDVALTPLADDAPYSVEAWIQTTNLRGWLSGDQGSTAGTSRGSLAVGTTAGAATFRVSNTVSTTFDAASVAAVTDGLVHHLVGTYDGTTARLYLDGALAGSVVPTGTARALQAFRSGGTTTGSNAFAGTAAGMAFYPHELTAARVAAHYAAGTGLATPTSGTMEAVVCWGDEGSDPVPATDTAVVAYPTAIVLDAAEEVLTATITVPAEVTPTAGTIVPRAARIGLRFSATNADLVILSAALTQTAGTWPLGALWLDPGAEDGGITTIATTGAGQTAAYLDLPYPGTINTWAGSPGIKKAVVTAPASCGGLVFVVSTGSVRPQTVSTSLDLRLFAGSTWGANQRIAAGATTGYVFPFTLVGVFPVGAGETLEVFTQHAYPATMATYWQHLRSTVQAVFFPIAVAAGAENQDAAIRYYDGDSWRPQALKPANIGLATDSDVATPGKTATTTTIARTPATVEQGQIVTLTGTVSPSTTGTVLFSRGPSASGPWTGIGTSTLASGKATKTWSSVNAGSHYFRATFQGSATHAGSNSTGSGVTTVQNPLQVKSLRLTPAWVQAYTGGGVQLDGSYTNNNGIHQGLGPSGTGGNRRSLLGFNVTLPADADVTNVELSCAEWTHWQQGNAGGTVRVGWHTRNSKPTTFGVGDGATAKSGHGVKEGEWFVNITSWAKFYVDRSDFHGLSIGPGHSDSNEYFGYSANGTSPWRLHITYWTRT